MKTSFKNILKFFMCFCLCVLAGLFFASCSAVKDNYTYKSSSSGGSSSGGSGSGSGSSSSGGSSSGGQSGGGSVTPVTPVTDEILIRYDYGAASNFFGSLNEITLYETIKTNIGIVKLPTIQSVYEDAFLGWFNVDTDERVRVGDKPTTDIDVYAKFDINKVKFAGLFQNGKYVKTWDNIKTDNPNAFYGNAIMSNNGYSYLKNLQGELVIGNDITEIQSDAFYECNYLTTIIIPNSVTTIGHSAFAYCSSLTSLIIGEGVTRIGVQAFSYCTKLENVYYNVVNALDPLNEYIIAGLFGDAGADNEEGLTLIIGSKVTKIPTALCINWGELKLTKVVFEENSHCQEIGENAFAYCHSLSEITIPDSVTKIGAGAFANCSGLINITIPNGVVSIGESAFSYCSNLQSLTIGQGVKSIGTRAFSYCVKLENVYFNAIDCQGQNATDGLFLYTGRDTENGFTLTVGPKVTQIPDYFCGYENYGPGYTVEDRSHVSHVRFAENSQCEKIGNHAFARCMDLISVICPNSLTSIQIAAFAACTRLENIIFSENLTYIGGAAFSSCSELTYLRLPDRLIEIDFMAFSSCTRLTSITIPSSVTRIRNLAFGGCSNLATVVFEQPNGWKVGSLSLSASDLSNPSTAARYLTISYSEHDDWTRS